MSIYIEDTNLTTAQQEKAIETYNSWNSQSVVNREWTDPVLIQLPDGSAKFQILPQLNRHSVPSGAVVKKIKLLTN